ncbi:trypsin-like [Anastrepha obliqua]|uniref:trypsin-like n=1 Tax=Anastrepha obliqua TaxID=95512 RepID=UPI0024094836|nr:trypsin-like [Anastrepha obliqua]
MANKLISSLLLLIAAYATTTSAAAVENGVPTTIVAHPFIASLQGPDGSRVCAGALIDSKTVVTAAQCLAFYDVAQLVVSVNNGARTVKIAKSSFDPYFDFVTMENDVAVLILAEDVEADYIQLASEQPASGSSGVVTSWAANNALVDISETIISADDCVSGKYKYEDGEVFSSMLCGLAKNEACNAVAGSPLVANDQLVGLVSWGQGCANKDNPAVFTNIAVLKSWIENTANNLKN